jgi:hypothetical protein
MKFPDFGKLDLRDLGKGLLVAVLSASWFSLSDALTSGRMPTKPELISAGGVALSAAAGYLSKNLFTGAPKEIQVDTNKTVVINKDTKEVITPIESIDKVNE